MPPALIVAGISLNDITEWLGQLWGLPGYVLVFLLCIFIAKGLRSSKWFPNDGVWLVMLLAGALLNLAVADPYSKDPLNAIIGSYRIWIWKVLIFGGLVGLVALWGYSSFLRRFAWFSGDDDAAERKAKRDEDKE